MKNRMIQIDALRGFAILLVVMGHAIAWSYEDWHKVCLFNPQQSMNTMAGGVIWQIIYSFHMALFFMISGFLSGTSVINRNNLYSKLKNKVIRLFIPYLATGYLIYFVRGNWGYWFLYSLFVISLIWMLIAFLLYRINKKMLLWKDILIMFSIYIILRLTSYFVPVICLVVDANVLKYFIPFVFGSLIKRHQGLSRLVCSPTCYTICLIIFVLLFISRYISDFPMLYNVIEKLNYFFSILSIPACCVCFYVFMNGVNKKIERIFAYLGRISMPIYILHIIFVIQIVAVGKCFLMEDAVTSITLQIVYSFAISCVSITLCLVLYFVLRQSALIRLLMFGEK